MKFDPNELAVEIDRLVTQVIGPGNRFVVGQKEASKLDIAACEPESPDVDGLYRTIRLTEQSAVILKMLLPVAGTYVPDAQLRATLSLDASVADRHVRSMVFRLAAKLTELRRPVLEIDRHRVLGYRIVLAQGADDLDTELS